MNLGVIIAMGLLASVTIFLGLPIGKVRSHRTGIRALLNAITIGVLLFLFWDVLSHAVEPVEASLLKGVAGSAGAWGRFAGLALILVVGTSAGLMGLAWYDRWISARAMGRPVRGGASAAAAPADAAAGIPGAVGGVAGAGGVGGVAGAGGSAGTASGTTTGVASAATVVDAHPGVLRLREAPSRLAFLIAVGIGLHNFAEGLAIGQSAASGATQLAVVLVIGFALHNATEGFGITAPLAGTDPRPTWAHLAILGVIGGGPTLLGTLLGSMVVAEVLSLAFLALAAGSIVYVLVQLIGVAMKLGRGPALYAGILIGLFAGLATDFLVTVAGV